MKAKQRIETQEAADSAIARQSLVEIQAAFNDLELKHQRVQERLMSLDIMLDNQGWDELLGGGGLETDGPTIEQIRFASEQIRELTAVNAWMKRGNLLRANYVWDGGIHYQNIKGGRGAGNVSVQKYIDNPQNQREFFSASARKRRSKAKYSDGHVVYIGNDGTKLLKMIPFEKITGTLVNPEDKSEVWAVRIMRQVGRGYDENLEARWIFLDEFVDKRKGAVVKYKGTDEKIDTNNRVFIQFSNPTEGWTWGTPDALAAMQWIRLYREFLISGKKMSDAMAMIMAQYKNASAAGGTQASVEMRNPQGAGGINVSNGEWSVLSTAGRSYDFDPGRALLAAAATALEVSVVALASDPGASGSSYGSAQTLDLPGRIAIAAIRADEIEFDERVLKWMGAKNAKAYFDSLLGAEDIYRLAQTEMFYWNAGLRDGLEQKQAMDAVKGIPADATEKVPDGLMLPNNEKFADTLSNDANANGGGGATTPAPDQGKANKTGGAGNQGNIRNDVISK